jgi:cell division protein FtsI (penicillin-binding protein 3)
LRRREPVRRAPVRPVRRTPVDFRRRTRTQRPKEEVESRRPWVLLGILLLVGLLLFLRYVQIQLISGPGIAEKARFETLDTLPLTARRGLVFDRTGRLLAKNATACSILIWPHKIRELDAIKPRKRKRIEELAALIADFGLDTEDRMLGELRRRNEYWRYRHGVGYLLGDSLHHDLVERQLHDYTVVREQNNRLYPYGEMFADVVGFVREAECRRGRAGIEQRYDSVMAGRPGWVLVQKDMHGFRLHDPSHPRQEPVHGADVHLTLDADVQEICFKALSRIVRSTRAKCGSAVVLDAATGEVLSLTDYPSFDPTRYGRCDMSRHLCSGVCGEFEPGSSFKIVVAAAALESPSVHQLTRRLYDVSKGYVQVADRKIHDVHKHGVLSFDSLFILSSNPGVALLSLELGRRRFHEMARKLGFGIPVGLGLPGETSGRMDGPDKLTDVRLANIAFGQGMTANLVQLAAAYLCVANDGDYLRPYLVRSIVAEAETLYRCERAEVRKALSPRTAGRLKSILARVVSEGTGTQAAIDGVEACGKTGTSQKVDPVTRRYSNSLSVMSFVGFFPRNEPRYVIGVVVDEPTTERFASTVACPVFAEIGTELIRLERFGRRHIPTGSPPDATLAGTASDRARSVQ